MRLKIVTIVIPTTIYHILLLFDVFVLLETSFDIMIDY